MGSVAKVFRPRPPTPPAPPPPMSPTTAEVSQSEATNADGYSSSAMNLKTKRKGRSATILTGPAGVQEQNITLGKKSLLGT
tara:strand:+ start:278 stop:520 length:243 start_codon:yes stop_codon:yes gene_type:complete